MFNLIVCRDSNGIIGINNDLYIKIKRDLDYFKNITIGNQSKKNIIVMGYNTWNSLPKNIRPLKDRKNIVISKNHFLEFDLGDAFISIDNFIEWYHTNKKDYNRVFIIGGESIYNEFFKNHNDMIVNLYITNVETENIETDMITKQFNPDLTTYKLISQDVYNDEAMIYDFGLETYIEKQIKYSFDIYKNNRHINLEEDQYLNLMKDILKKENYKVSRNGSVYSIFGVRMEFDLLKSFPLITTKRVGWKTILRELLWFISGSTNNNELVKNKVNIWTQNAEEYNSRSEYEEGDLGPIYGFQWRHFGSTYKGYNEDYENSGVDQLKYIIDEIKSNPSSRRLILNSWNPVDIPNMALPPCHVLVQFNITDKFIDCQLYQRSGDMFLGVPFNIASYAFLLHIIGSITNYIPRKLIHIIGDAHIYESHVNAVKEQLNRSSTIFPQLLLKETIKNIDDIREELFDIVNYNPMSSIKAPMIT